MNRVTKDTVFKREKYTLIIVLTLIASAIVVFLLVTIVKYQTQTAFADAHVDIFQMMVDDSRKSDDPSKIIDYLKYTVNHYPAGTIQAKGSHLDHITETSRKMAIDLIIEELRRKTGKDLGYSPQEWIEHFQSNLTQ